MFFDIPFIIKGKAVFIIGVAITCFIERFYFSIQSEMFDSVTERYRIFWGNGLFNSLIWLRYKAVDKKNNTRVNNDFIFCPVIDLKIV